MHLGHTGCCFCLKASPNLDDHDSASSCTLLPLPLPSPIPQSIRNPSLNTSVPLHSSWHAPCFTEPNLLYRSAYRSALPIALKRQTQRDLCYYIQYFQCPPNFCTNPSTQEREISPKNLWQNQIRFAPISQLTASLSQCHQLQPIG